MQIVAAEHVKRKIDHKLFTMFNFGLDFLKTKTNTVLTIVRFYERRRFIRNYGYKDRHHSKGWFVARSETDVQFWILGLLPRIKDDKFPLPTVPLEKKPNPWRKEAALFGQNDYIDILGDDKIDPTELMQSIPSWLRKFKGNEMQMLIRRRQEKSYWKWTRPQKWHHLNKRIDYLYKKLNYKSPPKAPEYPSDY